jgi:hypothetical protein
MSVPLVNVESLGRVRLPTDDDTPVQRNYAKLIEQLLQSRICFSYTCRLVSRRDSKFGCIFIIYMTKANNLNYDLHLFSLPHQLGLILAHV